QRHCQIHQRIEWHKSRIQADRRKTRKLKEYARAAKIPRCRKDYSESTATGVFDGFFFQITQLPNYPFTQSFPAQWTNQPKNVCSTWPARPSRMPTPATPTLELVLPFCSKTARFSPDATWRMPPTA